MEKRIQYHEGDWDVDLGVRTARVIDGTRREIWQTEALANKTNDQVIDYLRLVVHPDLCAALTPDSRLVVEGKALDLPISFAVFSELPDIPPDLFNLWWDAVYECNPRWQAKQDAEKKDSNPTEPTPA